ncbi:response regulator [Conexibacter sp. CPCC 206217]|uniref:response regulator n=1 Tax=Conexibacter sp. CPCC 206217 TaxID=3064574 RepID=UPI00272148F4|nr:response regulator [Conexibacter sp. CPCC 206217]MDO8210228.1 response regulator [Conexibacter sp. CPCC 206217]
MREPWRVLVIEDDRSVASIHCRFVSRMDGFTVVGAACTAAQARPMLVNLRPHLVLLDLGLPRENGVELLRRVRGSGHPVEVIAVTAASSPEVVRACFQLGVVDYLVKPFRPERLRQAMEAFERHMAVFDGPDLPQSTVDAIRVRGRQLPKDIAEGRLEEVRRILAGARGPLSVAQVSAASGLARSTARRYLDFLVGLGQADVMPSPGQRGRPSNLYSATFTPPIADRARREALPPEQ